MSCHTWFKRKTERTYEQAKEKWIVNHKNFLQKWQDVIDNPGSRIRQVYPEWSQEYVEHRQAIYQRQLRMVEKNLCKIAVMNKQPDDEEGELYVYVNGVLYGEDKTCPHDIFRVGQYFKDRLFSLSETIDFCKKKNIILNKKQLSQLSEFWKQHLDGMIEFG